MMDVQIQHTLSVIVAAICCSCSSCSSCNIRHAKLTLLRKNSKLLAIFHPFSLLTIDLFVKVLDTIPEAILYFYCLGWPCKAEAI